MTACCGYLLLLRIWHQCILTRSSSLQPYFTSYPCPPPAHYLPETGPPHCPRSFHKKPPPSPRPHFLLPKTEPHESKQ